MRSDRQLFKYMLSLIEKLKQVKDFRKDKGKRHPLWIVALVSSSAFQRLAITDLALALSKT